MDGDTGERLRPLDLAELLALDIKPRGMLLDPIIPEKALAMIYALRGTGKTLAALGIACAVASGGKFLAWRAPAPRRVLLVDGEMPAACLRERLARMVGAAPPAPARLSVLAGDLIAGGVGNLASPAVQAELERCLVGVDLLILDNLASLTAALREDSDGWMPIQEWLVRLRRRGLSVLVVHHAGRGGEQRGTSRREDVLDTSIRLVRPADYVPGEGARFEVHIEKCRGVLAEAAKPFEARLVPRGEETGWTVKAIDDVHGPRVAALLNEGFTLRGIADLTGLSKSTVHRLKRRMREEAAGQIQRIAGTA